MESNGRQDLEAARRANDNEVRSNRYAHLVSGSANQTSNYTDSSHQPSKSQTSALLNSSTTSTGASRVCTYVVGNSNSGNVDNDTISSSSSKLASHQQNTNHNNTNNKTSSSAANLSQPANNYNTASNQGSNPHTLRHNQQFRPNYYSSFSAVDWREQWIIMKENIMEKVEEPDCQRKLIMFIVCTALLLDNMLYMVIVPIIPDYLRSIGAWSTYTENAKWIRRNGTHGHGARWEQVGGQTVYEGEDSAVGFLFASKAIVQLIANPFSGALADRIGYEIPMMFGLIVMFFSTMVFACGRTYSVLFLARSLQGVGSAFADTPGIALLADRFTEETERRRAQGIAIAFISFGCLVAPPFGSVLYQGAGKEVPFIILSLVCLIDGSLLLLVTPPGTFSAILPKYYRQQQQQAVAKPPPPPSSKQSVESSKSDGQIQVDEGKVRDKPPALNRQKSISRRHSMTLSAGEAPKGTPIEVLLKDPCIACCAGALVVANISLAFLEPTISIWVKSTMPETEEWQEGMIWLPAFVPHVLGVFSTLHFAEKYPKSTWSIAASGLVIEGLGCLVVPFCSTFWSLIIPISVICFGVALIDTAILPTLGYLVDTRFTSVYGNVYAIADISYSVSYAIGPIIAGGVVEAIGFTALNFLIAIVTLGYTPFLMMLRTIRDYQPFEADQTGRLKEKSKPFGQFARPPIENSDEERDEPEVEEVAGRSYYASDQRESPELGCVRSGISAARYDAPSWAVNKTPSALNANHPVKAVKSVTIVEEPKDPDERSMKNAPATATKNPFMAQ